MIPFITCEISLGQYVCELNTESHIVRLAGDTDHGKKFETGAKSAEPERVRSVETDGGRERAENRGSEIRDAASCATTWNE